MHVREVVQLACGGLDNLRPSVSHADRERAAAGVQPAAAVVRLDPRAGRPFRDPVGALEVPVENGAVRIPERRGFLGGRVHGAAPAAGRKPGRSAMVGSKTSGLADRSIASLLKWLTMAAVSVPALFPMATSSGRSPT